MPCSAIAIAIKGVGVWMPVKNNGFDSLYELIANVMLANPHPAPRTPQPAILSLSPSRRAVLNVCLGLCVWGGAGSG